MHPLRFTASAELFSAITRCFTFILNEYPQTLGWVKISNLAEKRRKSKSNFLVQEINITQAVVVL